MSISNQIQAVNSVAAYRNQHIRTVFCNLCSTWLVGGLNIFEASKNIFCQLGNCGIPKRWRKKNMTWHNPLEVDFCISRIKASLVTTVRWRIRLIPVLEQRSAQAEVVAENSEMLDSKYQEDQGDSIFYLHICRSANYDMLTCLDIQ